MRSRSGAALAVLTALAVSGCDAVRLRTADSQETVLSRSSTVVTGAVPKVEHHVDETLVEVKTWRACDLVELERVRLHEVRVPDDDLVEELTIMSLGTIPLATGIILLADARNVYDDDRSQRTYNRIGKDGAIAAGATVTVLGGLMVTLPLVEVFRVAAAGEEVETTIERRGATLEQGVGCAASAAPISAPVSVRVAGQVVANLATDTQGRLIIDLAEVVPPSIAASAQVAEILVSQQVVATVDLGPVRDRHREIGADRDQEVWRQIDVERCRAAPPGDTAACLPVERYLQMFPQGAHAAEARAMLGGRGGAVIAEPHSPDPRSERIDAAIDSAALACRQSCADRCAGDRGCQETCAMFCPVRGAAPAPLEPPQNRPQQQAVPPTPEAP